MKIQPVQTDGVPAPAKPKAQPVKPSPAPVPEETPPAARNPRLMKALLKEPDVRATEVARGQALAADPNYPSDDILGKIAEIFVNDAKRAR